MVDNYKNYKTARYRVLLLIVMLFNPLWWYIFSIIDPVNISPLWSVILTNSLAGILFTVSFLKIKEQTLDYLYFAFVIIFSVFAYYLTGTLKHNHFYILGNFLVFICVSISLDRFRLVVIYTLISFAAIYFFWLRNLPKNDFIISSFIFTSGAVATMASLWDRITLMRQQVYQNKLIQRQLKEIQTQKESSIQSSKLAEIGEMSVSIAHEINNPLTIIKGNVEILSRYISGEHEKKIENIKTSVDRIVMIINSLKKSCRQTQEGDVMIPMCFNQLVEETTILFQEKLKKTNIKFDIIYLQRDAQVLCHPSEMSQVFINMINNSIHAITNKEDPWIHITMIRDSQTVTVDVSDSGQIPEKIKAKVFNPFFTTKPIGKGTGLGLSISRGIVEKHNGTMELLDTAHTNFVIKLPIVSDCSS